MCTVSEIHGTAITEKTQVLTQYKIFHHDICMETEKYRQLLEEIFNIHTVPHTDEAVTNLLGIFKPELFNQGSSFIREGDDSTVSVLSPKGCSVRSILMQTEMILQNILFPKKTCSFHSTHI